MGNTNTLERRVDLMDKRFDSIDTKLDMVIANMATKADIALVREEIESLAISTKQGFDEVYERMVTKDEFNKKMEEIDTRFDEMVTKEHFDAGFDVIDRRFDILESISVEQHGRRIKNLEDRVRIVETKTGMRKRK